MVDKLNAAWQLFNFAEFNANPLGLRWLGTADFESLGSGLNACERGVNAVPAWDAYPLNGGMWPIWGPRGNTWITYRVSRIKQGRIGFASGKVGAHRRRNRHWEAAEVFWRRVGSILILERIIEDVIRTAEEWPFWGLRRPRVKATNAGRSKRALGGGGVTQRPRWF